MKKEVYFGVAKNPEVRKDGSHCSEGTKVLRHWNCGRDTIRWFYVSTHRTQRKASEIAHYLERNYVHPQRFKNILTRGI